MDIKSDLAKLATAVSSVAPLLGTVLGGNYYTIALGLLAKLFGSKEDVSDILGRISNTQDVAEKLRKLENEHCEVLEKLANDAFGQEVSDRESARARQKELHDFVPTVLALGFLVIYAVYQFYVLSHPSSASTDIVSARFQDGLMYILAYYFGGMHKKKEENT